MSSKYNLTSYFIINYTNSKWLWIRFYFFVNLLFINYQNKRNYKTIKCCT